MGKVSYILFFIFSLVLGAIVLLLSTGWFLALFGILLLPVIIFHVVAGIMAINRYPLLVRWSRWSWFAYLVFAAFRPDLDDVGNYSGYTVFLHKLGVIDDYYIESDSLHFYIAIAALIAMIVLDLLICINVRRQKNLPPINEYV